MNTYRYQFAAECPNNGEMIVMDLTLESTKQIFVEHIKSACALHRRGFHEDIARALHALFPVDLTLEAMHHGVSIKTVLAAQPKGGTPT